MTAKPEAIERYRAMAEHWLRDAKHPEMSLSTRANAAFDAFYVLCRVALAGDEPDVYEHPSLGILMAAAARLDWSYYDIVLAVDHHENRYAPAAIESWKFDALMALAAKLKTRVAPVQFFVITTKGNT